MCLASGRLLGKNIQPNFFLLYDICTIRPHTYTYFYIKPPNLACSLMMPESPICNRIRTFFHIGDILIHITLSISSKDSFCSILIAYIRYNISDVGINILIIVFTQDMSRTPIDFTQVNINSLA